MKTNNLYFKATTSLVTVFLLLTITATISSAQSWGKGLLTKIEKASPSKFGATRTLLPQTRPAVRFRPHNIHRILERKLYMAHTGIGLRNADTWQITKSLFPVYKNRKALLTDLHIYTTLQKPDRVVYLRPQSALENIPETAYYVHELPQTLKYFSKGHIQALSSKDWVLIHRTDGTGTMQLIKKEVEARAADPLHKPLPLSFVQLSELPSSATQLWKAIGGKGEGEKYLAEHDWKGDFFTFFNIASESLGIKPLGEVKFDFGNATHDTAAIYQLPTDRITLNDLTYTKDNSYVLIRNVDAAWNPNTPAITIVKKDEIESSSITWFNK